jgi:hypothetical protein
MRADIRWATPSPLDRAAIYRFLGPVTDPNGWIRRVTLDVTAARHALPVVSAAFYDDDPEQTADSTPDGLLRAVARLLAGQSVHRNVYLDAVDNCNFMFAVKLGGVRPSDKEHALDAWMACATALRTALRDDPFLNLMLNESSRDADIPEDAADSARWAAQAFAAEVGTWNTDASRQFWTWWLDKAVLEAWRTAPQ